jgi:potassium/chloride transporter 4/5/6
VTISFLICYGFLNISCILLTVLRTPTWRPWGIFQLRWRVFYIANAVIGFASCIAISLVVSRYWTVGVIFFALLLYWYVARSGEEAEWGSGMDGLRYGLALSALQGLKREQHRKINWRPQILALFSLGHAKTEPQHMSSEETGTGSSPRDEGRSASDQLLLFCGQLRKGRGMCVVAGVLEGCHERTREISDRLRSERVRLDAAMDANGITGFSEVVAAANWGEGPSMFANCLGWVVFVPTLCC